jgi:hypothetical protein
VFRVSRRPGKLSIGEGLVKQLDGILQAERRHIGNSSMISFSFIEDTLYASHFFPRAGLPRSLNGFG